MNTRSKDFRQERQQLFEQGLRRCIRCLEVKNLGDYTTATNGANGINSTCNECRRQDQLDRYHGLFESLRDGERRARAAGAPAEHLTPQEVIDYWNTAGVNPWECAATGRPLSQATRHVDHIRPLSSPSTTGHVLGNIVPVHAEFNRVKGNRHLVVALADWHANTAH